MTMTAAEKIGAANRRRVHPTLRGKPLVPEHRAKISASRRGGIPAHGTRARYKGSLRRPGCRCRRCKTAWRDYGRELATGLAAGYSK